MPSFALRQAWSAWSPPIALVAALCVLVVLPVARVRYVQPLYDDMRTVTEPSRSLVTRIHVSLALEGSMVRDYASTRDNLVAQRYHAAEVEENIATNELEPLISRLGPSVRREFADFNTLQTAWHAEADRQLDSRPIDSTSGPDSNLYEEVLLSAARLDDALSASAERRWAQVAEANTTLRWITVLIATVALFAAGIVAWVGRNLRAFAISAGRQRLEIESAVRSRERLVRGITHDLKNPLQSIIGHSELLYDGVRGPLNPLQAESVQRIQTAAWDELRLINDLLETSRAEAGMLSVRLNETDLSRVLTEVVAEYAPAAEGAGHILDLRPPAVTGCLVTDANRVKQILANLVTNAIKYSRPGGTITLLAEDRSRTPGQVGSQWAAIDVADSGPGIPEDRFDEIFEEFVRLDHNANKPGSGLGLSIARRIAKLLGGDIEVRNAGGAVFTLWLPYTARAGTAG